MKKEEKIYQKNEGHLLSFPIRTTAVEKLTHVQSHNSCTSLLFPSTIPLSLWGCVCHCNTILIYHYICLCFYLYSSSFHTCSLLFSHLYVYIQLCSSASLKAKSTQNIVFHIILNILRWSRHQNTEDIFDKIRFGVLVALSPKYVF